MGLEDRIKDEMVVDTESILEEHFDDAKRLFRILSDGSITVQDDFKDAPWKEQILIHVIGQRYAFEIEDMVETPTLPYDYFYARSDVDDSTVRSHVTSLQDDVIVKKDDENGEWKLVPDNLPKALSRIEGLNE
jgi:DNA-binding transcriptional ArsR family regulator